MSAADAKRKLLHTHRGPRCDAQADAKLPKDTKTLQQCDPVVCKGMRDNTHKHAALYRQACRAVQAGMQDACSGRVLTGPSHRVACGTLSLHNKTKRDNSRPSGSPAGLHLQRHATTPWQTGAAA